MNLRTYLTGTLLAALAIGASAQEINGTVSQTPVETPMAGNTVTDDGKANWYVNMDYAGFEFELPAGTVIDKGSSLIAKYPDGTFGLSMTNVEKRGSNQKIAFELCQRLASSMHMPDARVERVQYGRCGGAKASGEIEGQQVTVLVLPYNGQEVTTVIIATPGRSEWVDHFLRTLKR